uniref:Uncharacterized protein n=1 Tax=Strongyloides stercoralis TaxID=6248 RepID=A0A0K0EGT3_STRER
MIYTFQQSQNDSHFMQYPKNSVILFPQMSNTTTGSSINSIMKAVNTDNISTESYILMPISVVTNNLSSSYYIPRPIANIPKSNSLSLSAVNLNHLQNSTSSSSFINNHNIRKSNTRYQIQQKRNTEKKEPFRNTIGVTKGSDIFKNQHLLPILPSSSICTRKNQLLESKQLQSNSFNKVEQNNLEIDLEQIYTSQDKDYHCKRSPSENNSVIYDIPNFNLPPSLPPHSSIKTSQNPTFINTKPIQSTIFQTSHPTSNHNNGYHPNLKPIIGSKYFVPPLPPVENCIVMKESKRQFKEILKNDRKLKKYQKKLQRGLMRRIFCSSATQLIWAILSIICLGFLAYTTFVHYIM